MHVRLLRKSWLLVLLVALVAPPSGADAGPADDPVSSGRDPTPFADSVSRSDPPASGLAADWEGLAPPPDTPNVAVASVLATATQVATGRDHTCALTAAGGVKCWGANGHGQLGDGTMTGRATPVDVSGLASGVTAVAAGGDHTCALTVAGGVKCWGWNLYGQLGGDVFTIWTTPIDVRGLASGITELVAGEYHTCALTAAGGVKCWGLNDAGQLGDNTTRSRPTPADVVGLTGGVAALAAGGFFTCALTTTGGVKCWGRNDQGQLGDGTTTRRYTPTDVSGLAGGVTAVAASLWHTCALTAADGMKCWGYNEFGQLGDGTTTDRYTPTAVSGLAVGVTAVAAGGGHTCVLTAAGGVKCWGNNASGQLGDGTTAARTEPADVGKLTSGVTALAAGSAHTCALTTTGGVKCWGNNASGQLGDGTTAARTEPADVGELASGVTALAAGSAHTCALTTAGDVKCWGYNEFGQLGDGTTTHRYTPTAVSGLAVGVTAVAAGAAHTCALTAAGGVKCWGNNASGQLGDGTTAARTEPADVSELASGVTALAAGSAHTCALTTAGDVKCWGNNWAGQFGDGTNEGQLIPTDVNGLASRVTALTAGKYHTCALTVAGGVKCWGNNASGQLGDGTTTNRTTPADVSGLANGVIALAAGAAHTCALTAAGGVKCWGRNDFGQLGDRTTTNRYIPTAVNGLTSGVTALAAGGDHTCALTAAGGVKCWGRNNSGQLGDGTTTDRLTPAGVSGLASDATALASGGYHTCALTVASGAKCWGDNNYGQLGIARYWTPRYVAGFEPAPHFTWYPMIMAAGGG